jgi:hypothetical protein
MLQRDLSTVAKREERLFEIEKQLSIMRDDLSSKLFAFNALEKTTYKKFRS